MVNWPPDRFIRRSDLIQTLKTPLEVNRRKKIQRRDIKFPTELVPIAIFSCMNFIAWYWWSISSTGSFFVFFDECIAKSIRRDESHAKSIFHLRKLLAHENGCSGHHAMTKLARPKHSHQVQRSIRLLFTSYELSTFFNSPFPVALWTLEFLTTCTWKNLNFILEGT